MNDDQGTTIKLPYGWTVDVRVDNDGQLNIVAEAGREHNIIEADYDADNGNWVRLRLTTDKIEKLWGQRGKPGWDKNG
jgi:hypothetical protein